MSDENIVEPEEEKIKKLAEDTPEQKGKQLLTSIIDDIENAVKSSPNPKLTLDTDVLIDGNFDTIKVVDGKVVFGDGHDLDWALDQTSPFQLRNSLLLAYQIVTGYIQVQKMPSAKSQALTDLGNLLG